MASSLEDSMFNKEVSLFYLSASRKHNTRHLKNDPINSFKEAVLEVEFIPHALNTSGCLLAFSAKGECAFLSCCDFKECAWYSVAFLYMFLDFSTIIMYV